MNVHVFDLSLVRSTRTHTITRPDDQRSCKAHLTLGPGLGERFCTFSNTFIATGHGHTTTWYKFWQHFKTFIIPVPERSFLPHYLYDILFYFIHVNIAPGQGETTLEDNF